MVASKAFIIVTATVVLIGCGGTPTGSSPAVERFPPFTDAPFVGGTPPNYAGRWQSGMRLTNCLPADLGCERAEQGAQFGTTPVQLQLSQSTISLLGQITIYQTSDPLPMNGNVTANGFIISGVGAVRLRAMATRISEDQLTVTLVMERFNGEQVVHTERYEGTFARSPQ